MLLIPDGLSKEAKEAAYRQYYERERERKALYFALRSRVLSDDEMAEVVRWDYKLVIDPDGSYNEREKRLEFSDALLQQFKLRVAAKAVAANQGDSGRA